MQDPLATITAYLHAIAAGEPFEAFVDPDMIFEELPNRVVPNGARSDLAAMRAGAERGRRLLRSQRYDVRGGFAAGEQVVVEVDWTGVLAVPYGALAAGDSLRARCAMIFELRGGRIFRQRNYDCYEPF